MRIFARQLHIQDRSGFLDSLGEKGVVAEGELGQEGVRRVLGTPAPDACVYVLTGALPTRARIAVQQDDGFTAEHRAVRLCIAFREGQPALAQCHVLHVWEHVYPLLLAIPVALASYWAMFAVVGLTQREFWAGGVLVYAAMLAILIRDVSRSVPWCRDCIRDIRTLREATDPYTI